MPGEGVVESRPAAGAWCSAASIGLDVLNAGAVMDSLEEKHLEAEDELNMEARPGPQFLTGTGFLRKCPLGLGEFSNGLACACFHLTRVMGREAFGALNRLEMLHFVIVNNRCRRESVAKTLQECSRWVCDYLKRLERFLHLGAKVPKGARLFSRTVGTCH